MKIGGIEVKPGDKLRCIDAGGAAGYLKEDEVYRYTGSSPGGALVYLAENRRSWGNDRFVVVLND
jgi:hypothetical protein